MPENSERHLGDNSPEVEPYDPMDDEDTLVIPVAPVLTVTEDDDPTLTLPVATIDQAEDNPENNSGDTLAMSEPPILNIPDKDDGNTLVLPVVRSTQSEEKVEKNEKLRNTQFIQFYFKIIQKLFTFSRDSFGRRKQQDPLVQYDSNDPKPDQTMYGKVTLKDLKK